MNYLENLQKQERPIRVVQFGEGNFLRAFVDYMLDIANEKGAFDGSIAIVKPISFGSLDMFREQDNLYTVVLRGKENGKVVDETHDAWIIEFGMNRGVRIPVAKTEVFGKAELNLSMEAPVVEEDNSDVAPGPEAEGAEDAASEGEEVADTAVDETNEQ